MSKKYTCTGMNCGGRVKGYADGGLVEDLNTAASYAREDLDGAMRAESNRRSDRFHDSGLRAPGRTAAENYKYAKSRGLKSSIVRD